METTQKPSWSIHCKGSIRQPYGQQSSNVKLMLTIVFIYNVAVYYVCVPISNKKYNQEILPHIRDAVRSMGKGYLAFPQDTAFSYSQIWYNSLVNCKIPVLRHYSYSPDMLLVTSLSRNFSLKKIYRMRPIIFAPSQNRCSNVASHSGSNIKRMWGTWRGLFLKEIDLSLLCMSMSKFYEYRSNILWTKSACYELQMYLISIKLLEKMFYINMVLDFLHIIWFM